MIRKERFSGIRSTEFLRFIPNCPSLLVTVDYKNIRLNLSSKHYFGMQAPLYIKNLLKSQSGTSIATSVGSCKRWPNGRLLSCWLLWGSDFWAFFITLGRYEGLSSLFYSSIFFILVYKNKPFISSFYLLNAIAVIWVALLGIVILLILALADPSIEDIPTSRD